MKEFNRVTGERLSQIRAKRQLTREQLAEMVEISDRFLYDIESGRKGCSAEILSRLSTTLCVTSDYLLTGNSIPSDGTLPQEILDIIQMLSILPPNALPYVDSMVRAFVGFSGVKESL